MNEAPDPLEAELSALRPRDVSPGLRHRIDARLADPPHTRRRTWRIALAAGLAAACLAAVLFRSRGDRGPAPGPQPVVVRPRPAPPAVEPEDDNPEPTVLAYERALARSPEALEALLDRQAVAAPELHPVLARIGAFTRSDAALRNLLGED
jgi:hypothetical protein